MADPSARWLHCGGRHGLPLEEGDDGRVEVVVERGAVEAGAIPADLRHLACQAVGAGRQEGEVRRTAGHVLFGRRGQAVADGPHAFRRDAVAAEFRGPELQGDAHIPQPPGVEHAQRVHDHGGPYPRVGRGGWRHGTAGYLSAQRQGGACRAQVAPQCPVRLRAGQGQRRVAAAREAEDAHPLWCQGRAARPAAQHIVHEAAHVFRPGGKGRKLCLPAQVLQVVSGMVDRRHDESCVGERLRRVVVAQCGAARAVRHDDQRQVRARHGAITHPLQHQGWQRDGCGRRGAGGPDGPPQRGALRIGGHIDEGKARSMGGGGERDAEAGQQGREQSFHGVAGVGRTGMSRSVRSSVGAALRGEFR